MRSLPEKSYYPDEPGFRFRRQCNSAAEDDNIRFELLQRLREFARRVGTVEKLKTAQRTSLAELDAPFATLQHRAFRGEL